jgi:hypothetical protein
MKTLNLGIEIDQGTDFNAMIGIYGVNGPINITGYKFLGEMRVSTDTDVEINPVVAEFDFTIQNQANYPGLVLMNLSAAINLGIAASVATALTGCRLSTPFVFDVKMKDGIGNITRIIQGLIYISPQATMEAFT